MKIKWIWFLILFSSICFAEQLPQKIYNKDSKSIMLNKNNASFSIKLESNPTTGYSWFLGEYDANLIKPIRHGFEKADQKESMGAPNYEVWTFQALPNAFSVPQITSIELVYARPWQKKEDIKQLEFQVVTSSD